MSMKLEWNWRRGVPAAVFLLALVPAGHGQTALPDGPGKDVVQKVCTSCHDIDVAIARRRTKDGWQRSVDDMVSRGADGTDAEMAAVVAYLTGAFGKANVNADSVQELQKIAGFSQKEAEAIVSYRDKSGKIKDLDQLKTVPGIDADKLQEKNDKIAFDR